MQVAVNICKHFHSQEHRVDQTSLMTSDFNPKKQKKDALLAERHLYEPMVRNPLGEKKKTCSGAAALLFFFGFLGSESAKSS